jgi:AhpD family alkylhydroperoxidase
MNSSSDWTLSLIQSDRSVAGVSTVPAASGSSDPVVPARRLALDTLLPAARRALEALDAVVRKSEIEAGLLELVRLRASQLNGCAFCVDVHSRDALVHEDTERRIFAVPVWREAAFFTARERAALELTEAMTRLADEPVTDDTFDRVAMQFTTQELAQLIWAIAVVNTWNRLEATTRAWRLE